MTHSAQNKVLPVTTQAASHPFHVLTNSKLPIFVATFSGLLALSLVAKLHSIDYISAFDYSLIAAGLFEPFFSASNLNYLSINAVILTLLVFIVATMAA